MPITPCPKPSAPSQLRILFYTPFKPLGHGHPSGDLITARGLIEYLAGQGHQVLPASSLRCRWIYWKPWLWPKVMWERRRLSRQFSQEHPDLWFTYHSYYKAPDVLGPVVAQRLDIPYVIFQGIYSTKRRKKIKTRIGFYLNRNSIHAAQHVFTNKQIDLLNLKRLISEEKISYIRPGLVTDDFCFDGNARRQLRQQWHVGDDPVVLSAAMFRPGVKTEGLSWVIRTCGKLRRRGHKLWLVIAGDGKEKNKLHYLAEDQMADRFRFVGHLPRAEMYRFYSAGDVFVFPGIQESLGMVYLEAQSCGLPVVAFDNAGVPEAIRNGKTGLLVPMYALDQFADAIARIISNPDLRYEMGKAAQAYVRETHDLNENYRKLGIILNNIVENSPKIVS
ncbi:MAG: glycosyltransferase family 4 protein [Desulfobacterales bacterium]|jgi:glycosyltransferase involved in cell wall biosynthesis